MSNVVYLLPVAAAVGLSVVAAARTHGRVRRAWRLLVVANVLWLAGELAWTGYAYLTPEGAPTPSIADIGYLLSYAVALPAILVGFGAQGGLRGVRGLLDAVLIAVGVGAVGWQLVIGPIVPGSWDAGALTSFAYPLFSVSILSVLIAVLISGPAMAPRSMLWAGAAFGVAAASDAGYAYLFVRGSYSDSSLLNVGWQAEAVLLCLAAIVAIRRSEGAEHGAPPDRDVAIMPALVAVFAVGGLVCADLARAGELSDMTLGVTMVLFLGLLLRQFIAMRDRTRLAEQLRAAAGTDALTGLHNRRYFEEMLRVEVERAAHLGTPLSLILIDLDRFKRINDRYGHAAGDAVLVEAANRLRRSLRRSDLIARHGGEEFVCLLPGTTEEAAIEVAEHIRSALSRTPVLCPSGTSQLVLTASLGVATVDAADVRSADLDALVNAADKAAYRAKARGRNRVVGSGRYVQMDLDTEREVPAELVWLADQIDAMLSDREHSAAVARWSFITGVRLGLHPPAQRRVAAAARLHDIGKISIPRAILTKPASLNPSEWDEIRRHPAEGARMVAELGGRPDLAPLVLAHHERCDGRGYPYGLVRDEIPLEARIIAVCDAWATMLTNRPYARCLTKAEAREQLRLNRDQQFDSAVVDTFIALVDEGVIDEPASLTTDTRVSRAAPGWPVLHRVDVPSTPRSPAGFSRARVRPR